MEISTKDLSESVIIKDGRPINTEKKTPIRDRDEKLRAAKERQNEERQRKIEELKVQAEAAQRFREQKEEERRRRIEELRSRDTEKRQQVEERKKAILEAEKERKEYILRKNLERDARMDTKRRNERSSIVFAFGSSTPRLLDPAELGNISPSTYWSQRRSTSISNVAYSGASITRRSSERELADGSSKKRATSAGGIDRHNEDRRRKSTSMYEVFNWGFSNDEPPKRYPLSIAGAEINIGEPSYKELYSSTKEETTDSPSITYRSVCRRKTDLMPTIPSPREPNFGSKSSLYSHTPRTPGRAVSMTRLDQLAQPVRRNGEHIRAIIERKRQQQEFEIEQKNNKTHFSPTTNTNMKNMSRSMTHLTAGNNNKLNSKQSNDNSSSGSVLRQLRKTDSCKSMTQLTTNRALSSTKKFLSRFTKIEKKVNDDAQQQSPVNNNTQSGSRSGNVTPGGSINTSRPGSAMSTSTTTSGLVQRRPMPPVRKPRPASIAGTVVSLEELKQKKEKPPLPKVQNSTPKRLSNSNSLSRVSSAERKSSITKKDSTNIQKPNPIPRTPSAKGNSIGKTEELNQIVIDSQMIPVAVVENQTKEEKNAFNAEKTEFISNSSIMSTNNSENDIISVSSIEQNHSDTIQNLESPESTTITTTTTTITSSVVSNVNDDDVTEEKSDKDTEKDIKYPLAGEKTTRELSAERQDNEMTASMIRKITTEEEAKAALAERRKIAREEAERQAELEKQRLEVERQEAMRLQAEEEERQRQFEEESTKLAVEQRRAEEERLQQAIEEAKKREDEERLKREEEEKMKAEKEESDKKAKEEAEKQRLEVAERLKREEKEREERRKRVEAIMSRTRKAGGNSTPNSTPVKENNEILQTDLKESEQSEEKVDAVNIKPVSDNENHKESDISIDNNGGEHMVQDMNSSVIAYEQSVTDKENALMKNFSNMIIDQENVRNLQNLQNFVEVSNGKINEIVTHTIANGNGHIENINNKNDTNPLMDLPNDQLINFSNESQQITNTINFNNNNSLMTSPTTTTLVNADSHDNKEISLL